jgi:hypothetical protein
MIEEKNCDKNFHESDDEENDITSENCIINDYLNLEGLQTPSCNIVLIAFNVAKHKLEYVFPSHP